jgi:hypothetical protein
MVMFGPSHARSIRRIAIAVVSGLLVSWLGVAALIALSVAWPHNPVPRVLLAVWGVLAAVSFATWGSPFKAFRGRGLVLVLAVPLLPLARAGVAVWPHLPAAVQDFLEGNFRARRRARLQRRQARSASPDDGTFITPARDPGSDRSSGE